MDSSLNIQNLPTEIIIEILSKLDLQDLQGVSLLNRFFYNCCKERSLVSSIVWGVKIQHVMKVSESSRFDNIKKISFSNQTLIQYKKYLSTLASRVEECDMSNCILSRGVIRELSKEILKETKLKKLNMRGTRILSASTCFTDVTQSDQLGRFGEALVKLTEANFWASNILEGERLTETFDIFQKLGSFGKLKDLNIGGNQTLHCIEAKTFGQLMNGLEVLNLRSSYVTKEQLTSLLDLMETETNLRVLKLGNNRIHGLEDICSNKLATALNQVEELELWPCDFTLPQMMSILARIEGKTKLKKVIIDEETDRYLSVRYQTGVDLELYPELRSRISKIVLFSLLPY
eukprot:GFUD01043207.1.p1 GENE.GFUD01043207.1~~GFUD01043207.1.p1  ORF type:complete len:346 (-),score=57.92 GFUD01043207.1:322-1359(-)